MDVATKLRSLFPRASEDFFKANGKIPSFGEPGSKLGAVSYDYRPLGEIVRIAIRGDPKAKQRARVVGSHAFTPKETKVAEKSIKLLLVLANPKMEPDGEHCFEVTIRFFCACRQRKDLDNMTKLVMDACTGIVWEDDSQVTALDARVQRGSDHPRTELSIIAVESDIPYVICSCGKKVRTYKSTEETRKFCSRACSSKALQGPQIPCPICGKLFHQEQRLNRKKQQFCSQTCFGKFNRGHRAEWLEVKCTHCGKLVPRLKSEAERSENHFCSQKCHKAKLRSLMELTL